MRTMLIVLVLAASAAGAEPTPVHHGDRIFATVDGSGGEIALEVEALRGTELTVKARGRTPGLEPEILIGGPDGHQIEPGGFLRDGPGSGRTKLKKYPVPETGVYTVIVRTAGPTGGEIKIRLKARHPRKIRFGGQVRNRDIPIAVPFPGFEKTRAKFTVRGRDGFRPRVVDLLTPELDEIDPGVVSSTKGVLRSRSIVCPMLGEYRLEILGIDDELGRFRAKVKLRHPEAPGRRLHLTGDPAGTFSSTLLPPWNTTGGSGPGGGGGGEEPEPIPAQTVAVGSGFKLILSILPPYPDPTYPFVWPRTAPIPFQITI